MVHAMNSKRGKYEPARFLTAPHRRLIEQKRADRPCEPMTGEQVFMRLKQLGVPILDGRKK